MTSRPFGESDTSSRPKKTYSIKQQMMMMFAGVLFFMLVIFGIINGGFLENYYIGTKQDEFVKMHELLEQGMEDGTLVREEPQGELSRQAEKNNIAVIVLNRNYEAIYINARDMQMMTNQLLGYLYNKNSHEIIESTEEYIISRTTDVRNQTEYLEMWGVFPDGSLFMMRSPLDSIRDAISIFNRFIVVTGIIAITLTIWLAWYLSKRLSDPILQLAELSKQMADLDFDAKYSGNHNREINALGNSFNIMSENLKTTISDLKKANNELLKDIELKKEQENMRKEFLASVSHELKTPIALVQGYAEGLKEVVNDDLDSREFYCDVIIDEAEKMNRLVKNLLTLNQLESEVSDVQFERFNITELIQGVLQSSDLIISQKEVQMIFRQEEPFYVWGDEFKIEQVLRNYVTNALNHVDEEKVIEVKITELDDLARISVFNTGQPIPEADLEHIWEKFYKVDKARSREYGGNGIGLSIVKAIMNSMHQEYGVNNYDNGVEFWFELDRK